MNVLRKLVCVTLPAAAVLAGSLVAASPANAASSPIGACGSGFYVIDQRAIRGATVYLMYNGSTNCVVTWKTQNIGRRTPTAAHLQGENAGLRSDSGDFKYYAGPVKVYAPGQCIGWGGSAGTDGFFVTDVHCG